MALKQYLQPYLWSATLIQNRQICDFLTKDHQVIATQKMANKWSRKARESLNKDRNWQRAIEKNPDKALHILAETIAKDLRYR
jgi:hypothetical protein